MKGFIFVLVAVASMAVAQALTETQQKKAQEHAKECMKEIEGVSTDAVKKVQSGDFSNTDDNTQCFTKCLLEKAGFVNEQGELQEQKTIDTLSKGGDKDKVTALVTKCKTTSGSTPCANAYAMYECYSKANVI